MGIVPGMPHIAFLGFSAVVGGYAYYSHWRAQKIANEPEVVNSLPEQNQQPLEIKELGWDDVQHVDTIGLEVGYRLIPLVDKAKVENC